MAAIKRKRLFYNFIWILLLAVLLTLPAPGLDALSAVALEQQARCGQPEHIHSPDCYYRDMLMCGSKAHTHTENCYLLLLSDNDINWLLCAIADSQEQSLEGVIHTAMSQALRLDGETAEVNSRQIRLSADSIRQLNTVIEEHQIQPAVVLNENLNDQYLAYTPPEETQETESTRETEAADSAGFHPTESTQATKATEPPETTGETEPPETTKVTEPPETTEETEPPETTVETEPPETTEETEPPETTEETEPPETTEETEPPETTVETEPPETTEETEPPETTEENEPPETTVETEPPETTGETEPPETTEETEPPETTVETEPPETTEETEPPESTVETEPPETTEETEPPESTVETEPPETTEETEPPETTEETEPPETTVETEPPETTGETEPPETTEETEPPETTEETEPPETTEENEPPETTEETEPPETTEETEPPETTEETEPPETTEATEPPETTEETTPPEPIFLWGSEQTVRYLTDTPDELGQAALYLYHNDHWVCIDTLDMDIVEESWGSSYSLCLEDVYAIYRETMLLDENVPLTSVLYHAPQSPREGIGEITRVTGENLYLGTDGRTRHFYLTDQYTDGDSQTVYDPILFHSVILDYTAADSAKGIKEYFVQSGVSISPVYAKEYLWRDDQGADASRSNLILGDTVLYALPLPAANTEAALLASPSGTLYAAAAEENYGVSATAVGSSPSGEDLTVNFYIQLDNAVTFVNSAELTYNNSNRTQSRKEYCSYSDAYNAYISDGRIVTALTENNIGSSYYFRHNTNGSNNFNTNAAYSNSNVYFSNTNNTQYAILATRSGYSYAAVPFFTVKLDLSAVEGADQVQYVQSGLDSTMTLSEDYLWYSDAGGTVAATAGNLENITHAVTLYARPKDRTVTFETNGGSPVEAQKVRHGATAEEPAAPEKEGMVFGGWYQDEALNAPFSFDTPVTDHITLYAKWLDACTVSYADSDGNTVAEPQTVGSGMAVTLPEGYTWTDPEGQTYPGGSSVTVTADTVFTGQINTYIVTFHTDESTVHAVLTGIPHGSALTLPADPQRTGHRFSGWYRDMAYTQAFYADSPVTQNLDLYAKWIFDVSLFYRDMHGNTKNHEVLSHMSGDTLTLPEHYTWTDPGADPGDPSDDTVYPGGTTVTLTGAATFIGSPETHTVTFTDSQGATLDGSLVLEYGSSFFFPTPPEGCVWEGSGGSHYIAGDYYDAVTSDLTFRAVEASLSVSYNVNFPSGAVSQVDSVPTLYGTASATATDTVSGGNSATVRSLTSNTARRQISSSNSESVTYYFKGWQISGTDVLIPADSVLTWSSLSQYADSNGNVSLVGQWEEGARLNSVTFFVRFDSVATDTSGNITSRPVEDYTHEIFNTHLGGLPSTEESQLRQLEIADTTSDNSYSADQSIRALYGERANGIWMYEFPKDEDVFQYLKNYLQSNPTRKLTVDGETVLAEELDSKHYAIRWYVFKLEGSTWHVDGKLVRREGLINIYKDFEGEEAAITQAEEGFYILAENGTRNNGTFTPYEPSHSHFKQHILTLDQATANSLASRYPNAAFSLVSQADAAAHTYFWSIRGIILDEYWQITEFPNGDVEGYSYYAEYSVYDSDGELTAIAEYGTRASVVGKTFALDEDPDQGMTVDFTNYYYNNHSILLKKEDAATGEGIGGAGFNFIQKDNVLYFQPGDGGSYSQNPNVTNTDILTAANGYVTIDGFSYQYGADSNTGERGRIRIQESIVPTGYGWAATVELELDANENVYISNIYTVDGEEVDPADWSKYAELPRNDILIVKNHVTELISVTAKKAWNTNVPADSVQVVLQANGQHATNTFPGLKNAQVKLSAANNWTYTWEDLPRYAGGQAVSWGIKEVVVGDAPTLSDGVTFANWIPVYSGGTGTDLDGDGDVDNWSYTVTNYSKTPKLILTKVGTGGEALSGAIFTLEQVELTDSGWQRVSGSAPVSQTTDATGMLTFENLVGTYTYRLTEVKAPQNHIILIDPLVFTVDGDGNIRKLDETGQEVPFTGEFLWHGSPYNLTVKNLITVELPETGGHGPPVYWLFGWLMMLSALLLYKTKRRKEESPSF